MNGRPWLPSHTALMAYYRGSGWPAWRIARALGFSRQCVQIRLAAIGWSNSPGPRKAETIHERLYEMNRDVLVDLGKRLTS